jgi:exopolysaccharide biosynthesis protein
VTTHHPLRAILLFALTLVFTLLPTVTALGQQEAFNWSSVPQLGNYPGIKRANIAVTSPRTMKINCLQIDTAMPGLRFHATAKGGSVETLSKTTRQFITESQNTAKPLVVAINANPWFPSTIVNWSTALNVYGLAISDGQLVSVPEGTPSLLLSMTGVARMQRTTGLSMTVADTRAAVSGLGSRFVLASGIPTTTEEPPIGNDTELHPRTGIGLSQDGRYVYLLTIDGRQISSAGATTTELGAYLQFFGARNGINMDGGGSTTMAWRNSSNSQVELLNSPSSSERYVANNLGVYYDPADEYSAWARAIAWGANSATPQADADGDGLDNLTEYSLGGNPMDASSRPSPVVASATNPGGRILSLSFRRERADVIYAIQGADTLVADGLSTTDIAISNSSFESPVTADYVGVNAGLPGWNAPPNGNSYIVRNGGTSGITASGTSSNQFLFLEPFADGPNSYVWQNTGQRFAAGTYELSVDIGYAAGVFTGGGDATANFQLLAYDGSTYDYDLGVPATTVSAATLAGHNGSLRTYSFTLNLTGNENFIGEEIAVFLQSATTTASQAQNVSFDNVRLKRIGPPPPSINSIAVSNSSFESPETVNYVGVNAGLPGWDAPPDGNSYIVRNGGTSGIAASGTSSNQFLFLEPFADGPNSYVWQNTGQTFAVGTYVLSVDIGYAAGAFTAGGDATAEIQLAALDSASVWTTALGVEPTQVSAAALASHNGSLRTYKFTLPLTGDESFLGHDIVVVLRSQTTTPSIAQNVSFDNVRLNHIAPGSPWSDVAVNPGTVGSVVTYDEEISVPSRPSRFLRLRMSR